MHDSNDEMIRKFKEGADLNLEKLDAKRKSLEAMLDKLNQKVLESKKNAVGTIKTTVGKMKEVNNEEPVPHIRPYVPPIPFPGRLKVARDEETGNDQSKKMEAKSLQGDEAIPQANEESTTTQNGMTSCSSFIPNNLACYSMQVAEIIDEIVQPITSPNNGYVASATEPILVDLAKELEDKILDTSVINKESYEPINQPHHEVNKSSMPSTKTGKVWREMTSPFRYDHNLFFPHPVANSHPHGVYCYFHPHLILSEGMNTLLRSK